MSTNHYAFQSRWHFIATADEVADILADLPSLTRWWPSVYLDVKLVEAGESSGVGMVTELYTKGWLPYTLRWCFRVTEVARPHRLALEAFGDFAGKGVWTIRPDADGVTVVYDWSILAEKPLLRAFSFILKPVFRANHQWAMKMGERSMQLELLRRRASTEAERAAIPPPPPPTFAWAVRGGGRGLLKSEH